MTRASAFPASERVLVDPDALACAAGGILVTGAITQHPELFAAALDLVGMSDTVRAETEPWQVAKFVARLRHASASVRPVLMRVDFDAGHGFLAASREQAVALKTDELSFLLWQTGSPAFATLPRTR